MEILRKTEVQFLKSHFVVQKLLHSATATIMSNVEERFTDSRGQILFSLYLRALQSALFVCLFKEECHLFDLAECSLLLLLYKTQEGQQALLYSSH